MLDDIHEHRNVIDWALYRQACFLRSLAIGMASSVLVIYFLTSIQVQQAVVPVQSIPPRFAKYLQPPASVPAPAKTIPVSNDSGKKLTPSKVKNNEPGAASPKSRQQSTDVKQTGLLAALARARSSDSNLAKLLNPHNPVNSETDHAIAAMANQSKFAGIRNSGATMHRGVNLDQQNIGELAAGPARRIELGSKQTARIVAVVPQVKDQKLATQLNIEDVRRYVDRQQRGLQYCYERALVHQPKLAGKLVLTFDILKNGMVANGDILQSGIADESLAACVLARVRRWHFPVQLPRPVTIEYPLVFAAAG